MLSTSAVILFALVSSVGIFKGILRDNKVEKLSISAQYTENTITDRQTCTVVASCNNGHCLLQSKLFVVQSQVNYSCNTQTFELEFYLTASFQCMETSNPN